MEPFLTSDCIDRVCEQYNIMIGNNEIEPLIMIPIFIHDFLCIHPFNDGNGRMSRLLTALLLYRSGFTISKYISIENKINDNKDLYYEALRKAQYGWNEGKEDCSSFILYFLQLLVGAYKDLEQRYQVMENNLSCLEKVKLSIEHIIGKFSKSEIIEICPDISLSSIELALRTLVKNKKLVREGTGKSTRYYKK